MKDLSQKVLYIFILTLTFYIFIKTFDLLHQNLVMTFHDRVYEIDTQKKRYFHTNLVHFFEAVNYHTKKTKKNKQSAFHTDLVN
jgi:hypothetical protein